MPLGAGAPLPLAAATHEAQKIVDVEQLKNRHSQFKVQRSSANRGSCFFPT
jgi:hypothetical protein